MRLLAISCLACIIISCKTNRVNIPKSLPTIELSRFLKLETEKILLSEISSDFRYFSPEADTGSYFSLMGINYIGPEIVILHEKRTQQLSAFKTNGEFIGNIGVVGQGPFEYKSFTDVFVFPELNEIHILISGQKKILRYGFNLDLLGEIEFDTSPSGMHVYKDKYYLCSYNDNELKAVNGKSLIIRDAASFEEKKILLKSNSPEETIQSNPGEETFQQEIIRETCHFFNNGDTLYYAKPVSGDVVIFKILDDVVTPFLKLDFKSLEEPGQDNSLLFINHAMIFGDFLMIGFQYNTGCATGFYDLKTGELSSFKIINDLDKGPDFYPMGVCDNNCYYSDDIKYKDFTGFWEEKEATGEYKNLKCLYPEKEIWLKDTIAKSLEGNPWIMIVCSK